MLTRTRITAAALLVGLLVGGGGTVSPASADCDANGENCDGGGGGASSSEGTVTVSVFGSFVTPGSPGSGGSGSASVRVPVPCYYIPTWSGQEMFDYIDSGRAESDYNRTHNNMSPFVPYSPPPGWFQHRKDTDGIWYGRQCSSANFDGDLDAFLDFAQEWFDQNEEVWVADGDEPPALPIPPEVLLEAATNAMTVPEPVFERNPDLLGDGSSLVNLATWFWQTPGTPDTGSVTAASSPDNSVTVDVTMEQVTYASPTAGEVTCDDGGTPYSSGATSDCVLSFSTPGAASVSADSIWNGTWTYNGTPQGEIDPVIGAWETGFNVAEVQSLVTDVD